MTHQQIIELRNTKMAEAQRLMATNSGKPDAETRAKVQGILAEADTLKADADIARSLEQHQEEQRNAGRPPRSELSSVSEEVKEERSALLHYFKTGEKRDILASSANGQVLVPTRMYSTIIQAQKAYGALTAAVKQDNGPAGPITLPYSDDRSNLLTPAGEPAVTAETDPTLLNVTSNTSLYKTNWVKYSLQMLNRSAFDLDKFITDLFDQRYWRGLTQVVSNGGDQVQSIYSSATVGATSASSTSVVYNDLVNLFSSLEEAFQPNAAWVMSSTMRNSLIGVTDTLGRPIFVPNVNEGGLDRLLGKPIIINQYAPATAASAKTILYGDLQQSYLLRVPQSLSIYRATEKFIDTAEIGLIGFAEIGGIATNPGDNRLMALQMKASS